MGRRLLGRSHEQLPEAAHEFATEGVRRLVDYQDAAYADLYLDRIASIRELDNDAANWRLTREAARQVALWMSYEDPIRVADLKVRAGSIKRAGEAARAGSEEMLGLNASMHARMGEVCETLQGAHRRSRSMNTN